MAERQSETTTTTKEDFGNFLRTLRLRHKRRRRRRNSSSSEGGNGRGRFGRKRKGGSKRGFRQRGEGTIRFCKLLHETKSSAEKRRLWTRETKLQEMSAVTGHFRAIDQIAIYCPFGRSAVPQSAIRHSHIEIARQPSFGQGGRQLDLRSLAGRESGCIGCVIVSLCE